MGLQGVVKNAAQMAFNAIGDLKVISTYTRVGTETYDADTGAITSSDTNSIINGVVENFSKYEIDGEKILVGDSKFLVLVDSLSFEPKEGDKVAFGGITWLIKNHWKDPAQAVYKLQLRMK